MASSRFTSSSSHTRDPRSALFDSYTGDRNRTSSHSPAAAGRNPYSYSGGGYAGNSGGFGVQRGMNGGVDGNGPGGGGGFRPATPNKKWVSCGCSLGGSGRNGRRDAGSGCHGLDKGKCESKWDGGGGKDAQGVRTDNRKEHKRRWATRRRKSAISMTRGC